MGRALAGLGWLTSSASAWHRSSRSLCEPQFPRHQQQGWIMAWKALRVALQPPIQAEVNSCAQGPACPRLDQFIRVINCSGQAQAQCVTMRPWSFARTTAEGRPLHRAQRSYFAVIHVGATACLVCVYAWKTAMVMQMRPGLCASCHHFLVMRCAVASRPWFLSKSRAIGWVTAALSAFKPPYAPHV